MNSISKVPARSKVKAMLACAVVALAASSAHAGTKLESAAVPAGVVVCNNLKNAQTYAQYNAVAPRFAQDMLDRANCFLVKERMEAVQTGTNQNYTSLKLLSGHVIWVPSDKVESIAATTR